MSNVRRGSAAIDVLLIAIAIGAGVLIVTLTRHFRSEHKPDSMQIKVVEHPHRVLAGKEQAVELILSNDSRAAAADIRLRKACHCSGVEIAVPAGLALQPGESIELDAFVRPSLDQVSIILEYIVHATVGGEQHATEQSIHISVEPPFEGWPYTIDAQLASDTERAVLRIGPLNPTYFAAGEGGDSAPEFYQWELRDGDLVPVQATLAADRSELWIEVSGSSATALHGDYMMIFSCKADPDSTQKLFIPVVISYLENV